MGGKDHASARYIFTRLEKIARAIFHPDDDPLLNYLNDDGLSIEPEYYMPVIPMAARESGLDGHVLFRTTILVRLSVTFGR